MYQVQDSLHHRKYILHFHGKYIKRVSGWPSERQQICSQWHCRVLFCKRDQYLVLLYTSNPSRVVNTNCHGPLPYSLPVTVLGSYAVSAELYGVTLKDGNLSAEHLLMTLPIHFVVALRYALDFMSLYPRLVTLQAYVPAVILWG